MIAITFPIKNNSIYTPCSVISKETFMTRNCIAMWDTGATGSAISINLVNQLKLKEKGTTTRATANGDIICKTYKINICIDKMHIENLHVHALDMPNFDILIGMDIIRQGNFSISGTPFNKVFSFCVPSVGIIDYQKIIK